MIGRTIGNYKITSELAQGGMGTVYRGHHVHLPREVVVKSILLAAFSPAAQYHLKARFRREAFIQSQLDHPQIVRVYEFFALEDNYFLVMEYVPGLSLRDWLSREGSMRPDFAADLLRQALVALDYAHNFHYQDETGAIHQGIIHRDIKPANLLLDTKGRLKITDFGIVKVIGDEGLTQSGFQPGTVEYMAPEQLLGLEVDERSDLYSLGVTFYEMLTGRLPFPRSATGSDWEVRKGHIEREPPPMLELRPDLPPALVEIVMRTLRKEPPERFQTARDILAHLHDYEQNAEMTERLVPILSAQETAIAHSAETRLDSQTTRPASSPASSLQGSWEEAMTIPLAPAGAGEAPPRTSGEMLPAPLSNTREVMISVPDRFPKRAWPMAAGVVGAIAVIGFLLWWTSFRQPGAEKAVATVQTEALPSPSTTPAAIHTPARPRPPAGDSSALRQARQSEENELYPQAIRQYETYLRRNPTAPDAQMVAETLVNLRQLQGLLVAAQSAMETRKYGLARQNYTEALKLRPDSKLARNGLSEVDAKAQEGPPGRVIIRPFPNAERPLPPPGMENPERRIWRRRPPPTPTPTPQSRN